MLTKTDIKNIKEIFRNDFNKMREEIIQFKDDILNEIIKLREDNTVIVGYRDMIEDHDIRITKLERKINAAS